MRISKNPPTKKSKKTLDNEQKNISSLAEGYRKLAPYMNIGMVWAIAVILFTYLGIKLDEKFNSRPWLTLLGAIIGIVTGFYHFIKTVLSQHEKDHHNKK
jgi:F0F1-type ATP synthase assembly protein I